MAIFQQDYFKKPEESIDQYNARISGLRAGEPITGESLAPEPVIDFKIPSPDIVSDITKLESEPIKLSPEEQKAENISVEVQRIQSLLEGKSAFKTEQEKVAGLSESQQMMDDLTQKLRDIQREQQAVPIRLQQEAEGRGITKGGLAPIESGKLRENAIQALTTSALIDAAQNKLTSAQRKVEKAVEEKYGPILEKRDILISNLDLILKSPSYSAAEKRRATLEKTKQEVLKEQEQKKKDSEKEILKIANEAVQNGLRNTVILDKIQKAGSIAEAQRLLAESGFAQKPENLAGALSILDVARYNELYPEAGVTAGDTETTANAKVAALNTPEAKTKVLIEGIKNQGTSFEDVVKEINADKTITDKDTAIKVAQEVYGITPEAEEAIRPVFGTGNFANVDINDRIAQLKQTLGTGASGATPTFLREQLVKDGYPPEIIRQKTAGVLEKVGDVIFGFLFGK